MTISLNISASLAISSKDELKDYCASEVDRDLTETDSSGTLDAKFDKWILFAEARFNRRLRCSDMERNIILTASTADTPRPIDYVAMRAIYEQGSPDLPLRGMAPSALRQEFDGTSDTPVAYCLVSGGIRLVPPPSSPVLLSMDYWAKIENLSAVSPSNWLLEKHPDVYVAGTLFGFYRWSKDRQSAIDSNTMCEALIAEINKAASNDRYGAGPLVPNTVVQVRGGRC